MTADEMLEIEQEAKALKMVTNYKKYFILCNEDGSLTEPLTANGKAKLYRSHGWALAKALEIVKNNC